MRWTVSRYSHHYQHVIDATTDRIRPRDCAAIFILFLGYFNAAMAYILLYIKAGGHAAYFYYAIFIATMLSYIAVVASITC